MIYPYKLSILGIPHLWKPTFSGIPHCYKKLNVYTRKWLFHAFPRGGGNMYVHKSCNISWCPILHQPKSIQKLKTLVPQYGVVCTQMVQPVPQSCVDVAVVACASQHATSTAHLSGGVRNTSQSTQSAQSTSTESTHAQKLKKSLATWKKWMARSICWIKFARVTTCNGTSGPGERLRGHTHPTMKLAWHIMVLPFKECTTAIYPPVINHGNRPTQKDAITFGFSSKPCSIARG